MINKFNKRPLAGALLCLTLFAGACSGGGGQEANAREVGDPPGSLALEDAAEETAAAEPEQGSDRDADAPEPVAMVEVLMNSGLDEDLAVCYSGVLAQNGVTEVADFDELADALTEVTVAQASEMDECLAPSHS